MTEDSFSDSLIPDGDKDMAGCRSQSTCGETGEFAQETSYPELPDRHPETSKPDQPPKKLWVPICGGYGDESKIASTRLTHTSHRPLWAAHLPVSVPEESARLVPLRNELRYPHKLMTKMIEQLHGMESTEAA
jgi:hypothetical protein